MRRSVERAVERGRAGHWLKHAFAVDPPGPAEPTEVQRQIADRLCRLIVRRRLTAPALLYLEVARPLNYVGAQMLHFFRPILTALFDARGCEEFASFLERRAEHSFRKPGSQWSCC